MRQLLTTLAEIAGAASIAVGAFLVATPLGFAVGGVLLIAGGYLCADGGE